MKVKVNKDIIRFMVMFPSIFTLEENLSLHQKLYNMRKSSSTLIPKNLLMKTFKHTINSYSGHPDLEVIATKIGKFTEKIYQVEFINTKIVTGDFKIKNIKAIRGVYRNKHTSNYLPSNFNDSLKCCKELIEGLHSLPPMTIENATNLTKAIKCEGGFANVIKIP